MTAIRSATIRALIAYALAIWPGPAAMLAAAWLGWSVEATL